MRFSIMAIAAAIALVTSNHAMSQTIVSAQSASIVGASGTIVATRVPVQNGSGAPSYFDVTINLAPIASGNTISGVSVTGNSAPSQIINSAGFQAGTYEDSVGNTYLVSGPGVGPGGSTSWSLVSVKRDNSDSLTGATWYTAVGTGNPEYPRIKSAKVISPDEYSFGVSGAANNAFALGGFFSVGTLLGASQTGSGLVLSSFSTCCGGGIIDKSSPTATWTLYYVGP